MAESVVSFLLQNLTQLLSQESKLLGGVEDQVRLLQNELSLINIFLKNTEEKRHDNELLKEVVSQIRDVAYEAEDVIDTFIVTVTKHKRRSKMRRFILSCDRAILFHDVAKRIESIKNVIKEIYDNRSKYGIGEIAESSGGDAEMEEMLHKRRRYVEEVQVVGFGYDSEVLVKQLIEGSLILNVVSIIGMGGLESAEEKFLQVCSNDNLSQMSKFCRISIHFANHPYISSNPCLPSNSRSVIGFGEAVGHNNFLDKGYYLKWLCESNKLVRVVELRNMVRICCLIPKKIENLVHLRYLSISSGKFYVIPDSICNLWNLETLDMRNSEIKRLPKGIWKLQKLRHLYLDGPTYLPRPDKEAGLPNLQVLTGISLDYDKTESLFVQARFPNLRKLGFYGLHAPPSLVLTLSSIHPLRHLQTLKLRKYVSLSNPSSLQSTLTKITLLDVTLLDVPRYVPSIWKVLGSLTNLRILKIVNCNWFTLHCDENSFCQLEVLKMRKVTDMGWTMEKGAMPRLQRLVLERCRFDMIHMEEICCLTALRDVEALHPDSRLKKMLRQLQMRDGCKLQVYPPLNSSLP
nr:putative disease resistance protein [Quercus suber]